MAKIAIDATPISRTGKGLSRFLVGLLGAVADYMPQHTWIVFVNARNDHPTLPDASHIRYVSVRPRNSIQWDAIQCSLELKRHNVDLLFSCSDRLPLLHRKPMLLYLFEHPRHRHELQRPRAAWYARASMRFTDLLFPLSVKRSKRIGASSRATHDDLSSRFSLTSARIDVIYPGREEEFQPAEDPIQQRSTRARLKSPDGYILHFSSVSDPRDNTAVALRAYHQSRSRHPHNLKLVVAGSADPAKQGLSEVISVLGIENDIIWAGFIPESELADTYRYATIYLDTSLYEGFGYQVIEAMACGTPVVCSNVTSLPEVVGDAAITTAPDDVEGFSAAIARILSEPDLAWSMRERGLKQVEMFSWASFCASLQQSINRALCE
ncbi:MAG: glycosyltransferase family 4 protein [Chloroflexi bacterium]|nr:glycosyltransferase family 4 protein [Chloroflexota bacterium]